MRSTRAAPDTPVSGSDSTINIGGQAVIEGVMMRSSLYCAVAVLDSRGNTVLTCELTQPTGRPSWQKWLVIRGSFNLIDSLRIGTRALFWSAKIAQSEIVSNSSTLPKLVDVLIGSSMVTGLVIAIVLFKILPQVILEPIKASFQAPWQVPAADLCIRMAVFIAYITSITRMARVRRVFMFHGAEHKVINTYENGDALTLENVKLASRIHTRCGTNFVLIVMILSVIASIPIYNLPLFYRLPVQLMMLFPVAGITFELIRYVGRRKSSSAIQKVLHPLSLLQLLTTREPDDAMLAVAIESLQAVIDSHHTAGATEPINQIS